MSSVARQDKLFKKFRHGDGGAFVELLESERGRLFDWMFRMTGQMSRCQDTIDEVFQGLNDELVGPMRGWKELRLCLYTTARRFTADIWGQDTSKLINQALEGPEREPALDQSPGLLQALIALDRLCRELPPADREILALHGLLGLPVDDVAAIMALSESGVAAGWQRVQAGIAGLMGAGQVGVALAKLPLHPLPIRSTANTVNLTDVMQGIKTRPYGWLSDRRVLLALLLLALAGVALYMNPRWITRARDALVGPAPRPPVTPTLPAPAGKEKPPRVPPRP